MATYDDLMSLSVRRGFVWPAAELYGGFSGFYDYGHLGARLRRNWEDAWLRYFLGLHENYHLVDAAQILPEAALKASGHVDHFTDVLVPCTQCKEVHRGDHLLEAKLGMPHEGLTPADVDAKIAADGIACPDCGGALGPASAFNMMFPVQVGPQGKDRAYLRPETAQGVFLNFKREFEALRRRLPMGLAIVGPAFRNEISPRQGTYRMREFHQAELQIFFDPKTADTTFEAAGPEALHVAWADAKGEGTFADVAPAELVSRGIPRFYVNHLGLVQRFYLETLGLPPDRFRFSEMSEKERAFYNRVHFDIELNQDSLGGFREVGGVHYRGDHDLTGHERQSGQKLSVNLDGRRVVPHVLELSFGVDRNVWGLLDLGHSVRDEKTVLRLPYPLAPVSVGVLPLMKKDGLSELAREIYSELRGTFRCFYDERLSIGRRYARLDEIGTPVCVTVDHATKEDGTVTLRDRDTGTQTRVARAELASQLTRILG